MARIIIRYRKPGESSWVTITVYDEAEAARWIAALQSKGFEVQS